MRPRAVVQARRQDGIGDYVQRQQVIEQQEVETVSDGLAVEGACELARDVEPDTGAVRPPCGGVPLPALALLLALLLPLVLPLVLRLPLLYVERRQRQQQLTRRKQRVHELVPAAALPVTLPPPGAAAGVRRRRFQGGAGGCVTWEP